MKSQSEYDYQSINAQSKDSVQKHHDKFGMRCEWIMEVKTTA
jgi:hypothetical protein